MSPTRRTDFGVTHDVGGPGRRKPPLPFSVVDHEIHDVNNLWDRVSWHSTHGAARAEADALNAARAGRTDEHRRREAEAAAAASVRDLYGEPWVSSWESLVDERFAGRETRADERRRALVLALSRQPGGQSAFADATTLTPQLALTYAHKTERALTADLQRLYMMGLIEIPPLRLGIARVSAFKIFE